MAYNTYPSLEELKVDFGDQAKAIHDIFRTRMKWNDKLVEIDTILDTYGVEGFVYDDYRFGLSYCNAGDTYETTITYCSKEEKFRVESWGDALERAEKEGYKSVEE